MRKKWLTIKHDWLRTLASVMALVAAMALLVMLALTFFEPDKRTSNDTFLKWALLLPLSVCLYMTWRFIVQRKFFYIETREARPENTMAILKFTKGMEGKGAIEDVMIFFEPSAFSSNGDYGYWYYFISDDQFIGVCLLKTGYKINFPSLVSWWLLRRDLKKFLGTHFR